MEVYDFISETNLSQAISQMSIVLKTATMLSKSLGWYLCRDISMESLTRDPKALLVPLAMVIYLKNTNANVKTWCANMQMNSVQFYSKLT